MKNISLLLCFMFFYFSCQNTSQSSREKVVDEQDSSIPTTAIKSDTIAYFEEFIEKEYCINQKGDTLCATGSALFIRVEEAKSPTTLNKISDRLRREISGDSMSVVEYLEDFIGGVGYYNEEEKEYWPAYFAIDVIQDVALNNQFFFTGTTHQHMEEGGAHGNYFSQHFNFDTKTGKNLDWRELFTDTLQIYKLAEASLKQDLQDEEETDINIYEFYNFPEDRFYLPNNFLIEEERFSFLYTVYEIGPYVQGEVEIDLTYEKIKPFIKADSALANFVNTIE